MQKAKSIDELYDEVRDFDMVITNDAPLATALNGRIDTARIGSFAYTPRQIAAMEAVAILGKGVWGDLRIISEICNETDLDFKYVHGELENIRTIRKYTQNVEKYMYSQSAKDVYRSFSAMPTIEKVMNAYDPKNSFLFKGKKVAVIGLDLFDDLDKHFVPIFDFEEIGIFKKREEYEIDTIYEIGNDRQLADNVVNLIDLKSATDTAIVMDTTGPVADAIRAALYRKKVAFKNTMAVKDLSQIRDYLQFLSLALSYDTLRVRHVREIFSAYGATIGIRQDEYLLSKQAPFFKDKGKRLADIMYNIRKMTFDEVCTDIVHVKQRPQVKILIDDMKLANEKITSKLVNEIIYAVNNVSDLHHNEQIPDEEKKGVLLVDCKKSVFIDRPFVIYVGIGPEWSSSVIGKEYIDRENEAEHNMIKFAVLLQQGTAKVYAVNAMRSGKESKPCSIFEQIYEGRTDMEISGFKDVCKHIVKGPWYVIEEKRITSKGEEFVDSEPVYDWKFSKSTYNNYRVCPRAFMFSDILPFIDSENTVFGSIIHEFAEFYLCYPGLVAEKGIEHYIDVLQDRYSGISCVQMRDVDNSSIRICMNNIIKFLDSLNIKDVPLDRECSKRKYPNMFMVAENCEKYSSMTEAQFISKKDPLIGNYDLIIGNHIIDYKTGKAKRSADVIKLMNKDIKQNYVEYQPIIYLSLLRDSGAVIPGTFSLFYAAGQGMRSVTDNDFSVKENVRNIVLLNETSEQFICRSDSPIRAVFADTKSYLKIAENWSVFVGMVSEYGWNNGSEWDTNECLITDIMGRLGLKDNISNRKMVAGALKKLNKLIGIGIYDIGGEVEIPLDTLDSFLLDVSKAHRNASEQINTFFPPEPLGDCARCNYFKACTLDKITIDEGDHDE